MVSGEIIINLKINVVIKTYKEIAIASKEMLCGFEMDQATIFAIIVGFYCIIMFINYLKQ